MKPRHRLSVEGGPRSYVSFQTPWLEDNSQFSANKVLAALRGQQQRRQRTWMGSCSCGNWADGPAHYNTIYADWRDHVTRAENERAAEMAAPGA